MRIEPLGHVGRCDPVREMHKLVERETKMFLLQHFGEDGLALVEQRTVVLQFGETLGGDEAAGAGVARQEDARLFGTLRG